MKIGIVGSGVSGLVSAWLLGSDHEVTVFEADARLGGHVHTIACDDPFGSFNVDTGFIVFNYDYYPLFTKILDKLNVPSKPTTMSLSVQDAQSNFEYSGANLAALFAQRQRMFDPSHYRFLGEIVRFLGEIEATSYLPASTSVADFCKGHNYSDSFLTYFLTPLGSSLWSTPVADFMQSPICFVASFMKNHGMDRWIGRPKWRVIENGSQAYASKLIKATRGVFHTHSPVQTMTRVSDGVVIESNANSYKFDEVIIACHADQALKLLSNPTEAETEILGSFGFQSNQTVLHTDTSLLTKNKSAWACWNFKIDQSAHAPQVTYNMNLLQGLKAKETYCVTLNRTEDIDPSKVIRKMMYSHPVPSDRSLRASRRRSEMIRHERISYCGAYWGYGFHEDGVKSAVQVASKFGSVF